MMPAPHDAQRLVAEDSTRPPQCWRAMDVAVLVAIACYGAAMLLVAAGLLVRLAR